MRNIRLILEYDGTEFYGYQTQYKNRTVQQVLEEALSKLFHQKIKTFASSRTDSGVHAEGQVANFKIDSKLELSKIFLGINHYLPVDVAVVKIDEVDPSFHAQHSAKWKTYEYHIWNAPYRSPLKRVTAYHIPHRLDVAKMKVAAKLIAGKRDFRAVQAAGSPRKTTVRHVRHLSIQKKGHMVVFKVEADGFLYKMIRIIVGSLLEVGLGKIKPSDLKKALHSLDRTNMGRTASSQGLILKEVKYLR